LSEGGANDGPLIAVIELRSNTMRAGVHGDALLNATTNADQVIWVLPPDASWDSSVLERGDGSSRVIRDVLAVEDELASLPLGQVVFMSNGGFSGIQTRVVERLRMR
jgi:UDP-N-acetylmuramate: L-alanyl-gamma-D-glutamyl-meso-diaminopimelate ligase